MSLASLLAGEAHPEQFNAEARLQLFGNGTALRLFAVDPSRAVESNRYRLGHDIVARALGAVRARRSHTERQLKAGNREGLVPGIHHAAVRR